MTRLSCLVLTLTTCVGSFALGQRSVSIERRASSTRSQTLYGRSLLSFERNVGQADPEVKFLSRGAGFAVFLADDEAVVMITTFAGRNTASASGLQTPTGTTVHSSSLLRLKWLGSISSSPASVGNEVSGKINYFRGQDPTKWRSDIPHYAQIHQRIYPGVDVTYYGNHQQLEYDLALAPGVDPSVIRLGVEGAQKVRVNAEGDLVLDPPEEAPHDRMREAVDGLIAYDKRRRTALLDTLERYLAERRSVIESARALFIHPNTLRQRLARIEELTGLELDQDDLLSLELAIKLTQLHGRPPAPGRRALVKPSWRTQSRTNRRRTGKPALSRGVSRAAAPAPTGNRP